MYRLTFDDDSTAIVYIWDDAENDWPTTHAADAEDHAAPFSDASGIDLFQAANRRLEVLGIRTPRINLADRSRSHYPAGIVVVEDVPGENLETLLRHDPHGVETTLTRLAEALDVMQRHTGPGFGKVALIDLVEDVVRGPAAAVRPRSQYGLIHGELGPDHVLVDRRGQPVLIDIEGLMFFDVEWEHAFPRIRFGEHYRWLNRGGLDEQRLTFSMPATRLSLVAGPLRLLDGDFPDRDAMMGIAEHNLQRLTTRSRGCR